jgi:hypothetical protein
VQINIFTAQTVIEPMSAFSSVNNTELIDRCPLGPLQIRIIVVYGLVALLDEFDLLAMAWSHRRWRGRCILRRTSSAK